MDEQFQTSGNNPEIQVSTPNMSVGLIIANGFSLGFKNFFSIVGAFILWIITLWIPYLNLGTTVGLYALVVKISRGEKFSPITIFDRTYRRIFPEFFVLLAVTFVAELAGIILFFIPGYILSLVWCISFFLLIDKGMSVEDSLKNSNKATYGYKWNIFGGIIILNIIFFVAMIIIKLASISFHSSIPSLIFMVLLILIILIYLSVTWGAYGHIYRELSKRI